MKDPIDLRDTLRRGDPAGGNGGNDAPSPAQSARWRRAMLAESEATGVARPRWVLMAWTASAALLLAIAGLALLSDEPPLSDLAQSAEALTPAPENGKLLTPPAAKPPVRVAGEASPVSPAVVTGSTAVLSAVAAESTIREVRLTARGGTQVIWVLGPSES